MSRSVYDVQQLDVRLQRIANVHDRLVAVAAEGALRAIRKFDDDVEVVEAHQGACDSLTRCGRDRHRHRPGLSAAATAREPAAG